MKPLKDVDSQNVALLLRGAPYGAVIGLVAAAAAAIAGHQPLWVALLVGVAAAAIGTFLPYLLASRGAEIGGSIYTPQGSSTPPIREYSLAESLVARGQLNEAVEAYELLVEDNPQDAEPAIRLARLLRDKLARFEEAAGWYRRALLKPKLEPSVEVALTRELIELYTHKLRTPNAALPYLKRLAERHAQHPAAAWAREQYAEIKQEMKEQGNE